MISSLNAANEVAVARIPRARNFLYRVLHKPSHACLKNADRPPIASIADVNWKPIRSARRIAEELIEK